jgi:hypothetical protein
MQIGVGLNVWQGVTGKGTAYAVTLSDTNPDPGETVSILGYTIDGEAYTLVGTQTYSWTLSSGDDDPVTDAIYTVDSATGYDSDIGKRLTVVVTDDNYTFRATTDPIGSPAPLAQNTSFNVYEDDSYSGQVTARSPVGLSLTYSVDTDVSEGVLDLDSDGSFTYTPTAGEHSGSDSFVVEVTDGVNDGEGIEAVFTRSTASTITDYEGTVIEIDANEAPIDGGRRVKNLFTDSTDVLAHGDATTAVSVEAGTYVFSMGAGGGTATFSGTATGSSGTLDADSASRTAKVLSITAAGTVIVTAALDLADIQLENTTHNADPFIPSEYVSAGAQYYATENGNTVEDGTQGESELVTNGGFDTDSDWDKSSHWLIANGVATMPVTSDFLPLKQTNLSITNGTAYTVRFYLSALVGEIKVTELGLGGAISYIATTTGWHQFNVTAGTGVPGIAFSRNTSPSSCTLDNISVKPYTAANDTGVVTEAMGATITPAPVRKIRPTRTNYADNTDDLTSVDTIDLTAAGTGDYTLSVSGDASVTVAAGTATGTGFGTATVGSDVTFNLSAAGTVTLTKNSGTFDTFKSGNHIYQLEKGDFATSWIENITGSTTRNADELSYTNLPAENETRAITDAGTVDVDDWDGDVNTLSPELVVNGTFDSGVEGWTTSAGAGLTFETTGAAKITANGTGWERIQQEITGLTSGKKYKMTAQVLFISGGTAYISPVSGFNVNRTDAGWLEIIWEDDGTPRTCTFGFYNTTNSGDYIIVDNISVREYDDSLSLIDLTVYSPGERPA